MTNTKCKISILVLTLAALLTVSLVFAGQALAQGGGSGNSGGGSGGNSGDQTQDRDRVQDPTTHDGDEPAQDRDRDQLQDGSGDNCIGDGDCDGVADQDRLQTQDRDRLQDGTGDGVADQDRDQLRDSSLHIGDEPIQDRDKLRDRLRDQLEDPDQDRDRDRIRANDATGLQEVITVGEAVRNDVTNGLRAEIRELARNRNRVDVGVMALIASQNMIGQEGGTVANLAQEIHGAHRNMTQAEEHIQSRGFLSRFFLGGDTDSATAIQNQLQQNEQHMEQIRQYLDDCDCDEQVRTMLQEQVQVMEEEHARLRQVAEDEVATWGLFSWRF